MSLQISNSPLGSPLFSKSMFGSLPSGVRGMAAPLMADALSSAVGDGINDLTKFLSQSKLDFHNSDVAYSSDELKFSLAFREDGELRVNANGVYAKRSQSLSVSVEATFDRVFQTDQGTEVRTFRMRLDMRAEQIDERSVRKMHWKEDVVSFFKRVIEDILDVAKNDDYNLAGISLKKEDLQELLAMSEEDEIGKVMVQLLSMALALAKLKAVTNDNEDAEEVTLSPRREEADYIEDETKREKIVDFSMSIEEVSARIVENDADAIEGEPTDAPTTEAPTTEAPTTDAPAEETTA